jgi:hypothetical protein
LPAVRKANHCSASPPAYDLISASQRRNRNNCLRSLTRNRKKSRPRTSSACLPVNVSSRHRRYSLRQGRSRWPRVAVHRNLKPSPIRLLRPHYRFQPAPGTHSHTRIASIPSTLIQIDIQVGLPRSNSRLARQA